MKKLSIVLLILFTMGIFLACDDNDDDSSSIYNFKVMAYAGGFSGYYIVDGKDIITFEDEGLKDGYYIFTKYLDSPTTLYVNVDGEEDNATLGTTETQSLKIQIFEDDYQVNSISANKDSEVHLGIELYHDFSEDDSEE